MSVVADSSKPLGEPPAPAESLVRFSVEQYHDMARLGILPDGDPIELLEGLLVKKMTISPAHRLATRRVRIALERTVPAGFYVDAPSPVTLQRSEPEPDVVLVRGADDDYINRHPGPGDVALLVEVSDSSLRRDQGFKKLIYAKASIPIYWIVNLIDRRIEVYSDPAGPVEHPDYRGRRDFSEAEQVPLVIDGREVAQISVREILG
jgi:Uma2 family endonuclease